VVAKIQTTVLVCVLAFVMTLCSAKWVVKIATQFAVALVLIVFPKKRLSMTVAVAVPYFCEFAQYT
jgi:hypothetical protein